MALLGLDISLTKIKSSSANFLGSLAGVAFLCFSPLSHATFPNILGTYSGTVTADEFDCTLDGAPGSGPPLSSLSEQTPMTLTISTLDTGTGAFSGSGTQTFSDGVDTFTFGGFVDSAGNVSSCSWSAVEHDGNTSSGSCNGSSVSDGVLFLEALGADDGPFTGGDEFCNLDTHGSLSLGGGGVFVSEETPSSTLTSIARLNSDISSLTTGLGARIQNVTGRGIGRGVQVTANRLMLEGSSGLNAGDGVIPYGAWISYSYSDFDNDLSSTAFDGNRHLVLGGFDFAPWESTVFGVAVGYEDSDTDTTFNRGNQETDGYTIAPYFGALLTDTWSVNFSFGYSNIDYDQFRTDPATGTRVTSSPDADRWFGMFNLNGVTYYDNWILGGRVGTMWAKNEIDAFTESDGTAVAEVRSKLGSWNIGGDVAYSFGEFEPFVSATYQNDYSMTEIVVGGTGPQPANDRDDVLVAAGIRYFGANGISGNLDWTRRLGREDFDEDMFTLSIRVDF